MEYGTGNGLLRRDGHSRGNLLLNENTVSTVAMIMYDGLLL